MFLEINFVYKLVLLNSSVNLNLDKTKICKKNNYHPILYLLISLIQEKNRSFTFQNVIYCIIIDKLEISLTQNIYIIKRFQ